MKRILILLSAVFFLTIGPAQPVSAQAVSAPSITQPKLGEALQGVVTINGSTDVPGFLSSEISFSYSGDPTGTWFLIGQANHPVSEAALATWDTTSITDGAYTLRLRVYLSDGSFQDAFVFRLRVRNYTPIETPTPAPTSVQPTQTAMATLTPTPYPTPTGMPTNPAVLTPANVSLTLGYGGLGAVLLLALMGVYLWLRRK